MLVPLCCQATYIVVQHTAGQTVNPNRRLHTTDRTAMLRNNIRRPRHTARSGGCAVCHPKDNSQLDAEAVTRFMFCMHRLCKTGHITPCA
jgi:hypothetical protein